MRMNILSAGPLTTIQDEGRFGHMASGFSPNGAMDLRSLRIANILAGNVPGDAALEMTMMGVTASFDCDTVLALTGADMSPLLDGEEIPMYRAIPVSAGSVLQLGMAKSGMRGYLAVSGGFDIPHVMGSFSTNLKVGLGGFAGRKLQNGDEIPLRTAMNPIFIGKRVTVNPDTYPSEITLRVVPGPQDDYFTEDGKRTFLSTAYTVTDKSDRMGVRLDGSKIESKNGVDILSDGVATGSVQIPASGTPIIMMADRQTTGGYAKIATVISADLPQIAQAKPGTKVRFAAVTQQEAAKIYKKDVQRMKMLEYQMLMER